MKPDFINGLFEPHKNFIRGLTNYTKLKGMVNGIEKEINIFFDKHLDLDEQTKYESFNSIDILSRFLL